MIEPTFTTVPLQTEVPREQEGNLLLGLLFHLGPSVTFVLALMYWGMTMTSVIVLYLLVAFIFMVPTVILERHNPAVAMEMPTGWEFVHGMSVIFYKGLLVGGAFVAGGWWLFSKISPITGTHNGWLTITIAVLLTDFFYYMIHRFLSHGVGEGKIVSFYRHAHGFHHSVAELDFIRGNQSSLVDTALSQFQPSIIVISAFLGMDLPSTFVAYFLVFMLQSTDHVNFTCNIGILKYIFMDNHAHRFHHCRRGNLVNHGAVFSFYDRIFGTYYEDWNISSGFLHHHRLLLPIRSLRHSLFPKK
jgi:sterol desaturase/sphingolipid hydroxylase (fatty acid hydroxylase superfamily)